MEPRRALIKHRGNGKSNGGLVQFEPERFRLNDRAIDFGIEEAKRIKDWPALEAAIDLKLEQLALFVAWWERSVRDKGWQTQVSGLKPELSESQAKKLTGIGKVQKHRMAIRLRAADEYRDHLLGVEYLAANLAEPHNHRGEGTGNNEWHTPAMWIDLARTVLGGIDLDPASSPIAQKTVKAKKFYKYVSENDNGLTQEWKGRVWLNPPYSPKEIAAFSSKMIEEFTSGHVTAAIMLTHNYTDSSWFQRLARAASAVCFPSTRIRFEDPHGVPCSPTQGQALFYFGTAAPDFVKWFAPRGIVMSQVEESQQ